MMSDLSGRTTVVVGASRGLGRGIARAFAEAGAPVVAVARTGPALAELATCANIRTEVADAADAMVALSLLDTYEPEVLILVAGANAVMRPLHCRSRHEHRRGTGCPSVPRSRPHSLWTCALLGPRYGRF